MLRIALSFGLVLAVLSQCPPPSNCPGSGKNTASGGSGSDENTCKEVTTIDRTMTQVVAENPSYYTLLPNRSEYSNIDNVCLTCFPLPDSSETFAVYESVIFSNETNVMATYTGVTDSTGIFVWANTKRTFKVYVLGLAGCGAYVNYRCGIIGDTTPFIFALGPSPGGCSEPGNGTGLLSTSCQLKAQSIVEEAGLTPSEGYYVLPYKLPTNCITQQLCLPSGNPIYCQQGGKCQPYESSSIFCPSK